MTGSVAPGRISVCSGVEREDEVYSARQLAARDTEQSLVKSEKLVSNVVNEANVNETVDDQQPAATTKLCLQVQVTGSNSNETDVEEPAIEPVRTEHKATEARAQKPIATVLDPTKPLTVTTSTFRAAAPKEKKEPGDLQDGSRKDNTFPRPVRDAEKSFVGVQALKESLEESLKANNQPKRKLRPSRRTTPFIFQVSFTLLQLFNPLKNC